VTEERNNYKYGQKRVGRHGEEDVVPITDIKLPYS
jgi:hypothetical protein